MKRDQATRFWWMHPDLIGIMCANPHCGRAVADGSRLYCDNPTCRKVAWYYTHLSAESRKSLKTLLTSLESKVDHLTATLEALPKQLSLFPTGGSPDDLPQASVASPQRGQIGKGQHAIDGATQPSRTFTDKDLDDIDLQITSAKSSADNNPNWNFMIASTATVYGNYDALDPQIIDYGIRTGKINPADVKQKSSPRPLGEGSGVRAQGPKQMDVPQFDAPTFDDEEDLIGVS